jgi:broad specificity phosphatase PhoE
MMIKLVRHGESLANIETDTLLELGDHRIPLTDKGVQQAYAAGQKLGTDYLRDALVYTSPFLRARQTLAAVLEGAGLAEAKLQVREDPRLREVEHGYCDIHEQQYMIQTHGHFYYRYQGGESPADCYDRISGFLESFVRSVRKTDSQKALIVTHGLALRVFVMRFLHLTVEQFDQMANPGNAEIVTIAHAKKLQDCMCISGKWGVSGIRYYTP